MAWARHRSAPCSLEVWLRSAMLDSMDKLWSTFLLVCENMWLGFTLRPHSSLAAAVRDYQHEIGGALPCYDPAADAGRAVVP